MQEYYETNLMYHFKEYRKGLTKLFRCSSEHHSEQFRLKMHILYHHLFATDLQNIKTVQSSRCHFFRADFRPFYAYFSKKCASANVYTFCMSL